MVKVVFLIQMLPAFGGRCNRYFWEIRPNILRLPNLNMLFKLGLTKFFKSDLFSCLPKVGHVIKSCKEYPASTVTLIFPRRVREEEATLPTSSNSFDLSIIPRFGWVRQVSYWINQFYLCTHAYSRVLLTLSAPTLYNKMNSCNFNFMQKFWENYKLNVQF